MNTAGFTPDPEGQTIPGLPSLRFWPILRPVDGMASNSYVISAGSCFLVIDPGADEDQTRRILGLIRKKRTLPSQSALLLLTHCHRDHSLEIRRWVESGIPFHVLGHISAAQDMQKGDTDPTLAYLYGEEPPLFDISLPLFLPDGEDGGPVSGGPFVEVLTRNTTMPPGLVVERQIMELDRSVRLEIYHSPGHSRDSVCYLMGDCLFTGDILFADKPGVAGIPGWSQPCLLKTLDMVEWLIRTRGIERCYPGHGPMVPAGDVMRLIGSAKQNASGLQKLIRLDSERVSFLKACAETFVYEAGLLFSVLGGRLQLLAERLADLEETELAQTLIRGIDLERMEEFIAEFQAWAQSAEKSGLRMEGPLKAVSTIGRVRRVFRQASLPGGVAEVLLQRIEWLLKDYVSIATGIDLSDHLVDTDVREIVREASAAFEPFAWTLDEGGEAAEDPGAFALFLARAMDFRPTLPPIAMGGYGKDSPFRARTDPLRLKLLFIDVLEQMAIRKPSAIHVDFEKGGENRTVSFFFEKTEPVGFTRNKIQYYRTMMGLLCGRFEQEAEGERYCLRFSCPVPDRPPAP